MVGIGNHEAWYNWTAVTSRFTMPRGGSSSDNATVASTAAAVPPFWWSMDHGLAHWVMLCSEFPLDEGSPQGQWLRRDLAWANAAAAAAADDKQEEKRGQQQQQQQQRRRPWIVVTIHRPLSSSDRSWIDLRLELEPLLAASRVDLVLSGHMHAYERTHAVASNGSAVVLPATSFFSSSSSSPSSSSVSCEVDVYEAPPPGYPVYVTQGNSGAVQAERWERPSPDWSAARWANGRAQSWRGDGRAAAAAAARGGRGRGGGGGAASWSYSDSFGFGLVSFLNATALAYESVPVTGTFCDKFMISRPVPVALD